MAVEPFSRRGIGVSVGSVPVSGIGFAGGSPRSFSGRSSTTRRQLAGAEIRRHLPDIPPIHEPVLIDLIFDLSGSMWGGNDAKGMCREAALISLEHAAARRRRDQWFARVTSFDLNSAIELPVTRLDRRGVDAAETALLGASPGGSSSLGPALRAAEDSSIDRRLLVVHSDFELFDADVSTVLSDLADSTATHVLALVYTSSVPTQLVDSRVECHRIDPVKSKPTDVARHIAVAAAAVAAGVDPTAVSSPTSDTADRLHTVVSLRRKERK